MDTGCRKAYCVGGRSKPAIVVDDTLALWIGNESSEEVSYESMEICGFNVGAYEEKVVAGNLM